MNRLKTVVAVGLYGLVVACSTLPTQLEQRNGRLVSTAENAPLIALHPSQNRLVYGLYANEQQSQKAHLLPDFSYAGFGKGGVALPAYEALPLAESLAPADGDDGPLIQAAIDRVSKLPLNEAGYRGVILLKRGHYEVGQELVIHASGVILRGEGQGDQGTVLTSTSTQHRASLFTFMGRGSGNKPKAAQDKRPTPITQALVPVGSSQVRVESTEGYRVGDEIAVVRSPNDHWVSAAGVNTAQFGWKASSYTLAFEKTITAIEGNTLHFDVPMVDTIEQRFGGGLVYRIDVSGRLSKVGLENLQLRTLVKKDVKDENRGFYAINFREVQHSWVRDVTVKHFSHAFNLRKGTRFNTIENVAFVEPSFRVTGGRHYGFNFDGGSLNLFQRCYGNNARHTFVSGSRVTGPNVFLDCTAVASRNDSGPHHRWATGTLYDNTQGWRLRVQNRKTSGSGHGWAGAQQMLWNTDHDENVIQAPPHAMSWAVGMKGKLIPGQWSPSEANGIMLFKGQEAPVRSLYLQQLEERLGPQAVAAITTPAQRVGTIWAQLKRWQGKGKLADY